MYNYIFNIISEIIISCLFFFIINIDLNNSCILFELLYIKNIAFQFKRLYYFLILFYDTLLHLIKNT